jgi:hypothetical protein
MEGITPRNGKKRMANPNPNPATRFQPGNPGGPGAPRGSRKKPLTDRFIKALEDGFISP